ISKRLGISGSILWRRGTESISRALGVDDRGATSALTEALFADWILPRVLAEGHAPQTVVERLRGAAVDAGVISGPDGDDNRLSRSLGRLERIAGEGVSGE